MSTLLTIAVIVGIISAAVIVWAVTTTLRSAAPAEKHELRPRADNYEAIERSSMPEEIANGTLVVSEETLHRSGARPLAAKTDQVFRTPLGLLVPVETKTRKRVFASDIVQLSCQAAALSERGVVADYGYVRLQVPGRRPNYQKARLMSAEEIDRLYDRYQLLRLKRVKPIPRPSKQRCGRCAYRNGCPAAHQ